MKYQKRNYKKMKGIAKGLGLIWVRDGYIRTSKGLEVDLTGTDDTKEAMLYIIGKASL